MNTNENPRELLIKLFQSSFGCEHFNNYAPFLPLFAKIDKMLSHKNVVIAIEGGSASGKTTLGSLLEALYDCTVLHMDDFFLRPEQRTTARYAEVGGNVDYERFLDEVLMKSCLMLVTKILFI